MYFTVLIATKDGSGHTDSDDVVYQGSVECLLARGFAQL